jgi:hypothetical protein
MQQSEKDLAAVRTIARTHKSEGFCIRPAVAVYPEFAARAARQSDSLTEKLAVHGVTTASGETK